ncbi:hypothetical protein GCM10007387_29080 [Pseudoduganella albidiflava]|uniref:Uncharacterized protein n=1 Tax=Pseudoduganella albidiflava TaxID=321983 RepID=A0AA87XXS5_9BURK|nr:hypothetical protein GCM10007387_29080 [Pseudoduganella albidiflava]
MATVNIIIPVNSENHDEVKLYYLNALLCKEGDGLLFLPIENDSIALLIMNASSEDEPLSTARKQLPHFSFEVQRNFLSFCLAAYKRGALFDMACRHPGGYYARLFDPVGNQFEIWCSSDEDDYIVETDQMPFFYTY